MCKLWWKAVKYYCFQISKFWVVIFRLATPIFGKNLKNLFFLCRILINLIRILLLKNSSLCSIFCSKYLSPVFAIVDPPPYSVDWVRSFRKYFWGFILQMFLRHKYIDICKFKCLDLNKIYFNSLYLGLYDVWLYVWSS